LPGVIHAIRPAWSGADLADTTFVPDLDVVTSSLSSRAAMLSSVACSFASARNSASSMGS
jgi:hypothetical protein